MTSNPITDSYDLGDGNASISLTVSIKLGQTSVVIDEDERKIFGVSAVYIDNRKFKLDVFDNEFLGTTNDLRGKTVLIVTPVLDINPETNDTKVDYKFTGGASNQSPFTSQVEVAQDGDPVVHIAEITLV